MAKKSIGLASLKMGDIAADGGMGAALSALGATVSDTAVLANEAASVTDFLVEEQDDPFFSQSTPGKRTLTWSTYDVDPATLERVFGGTYTPATALVGASWEAPASTPTIEQSIELTTKDGWVISIVRAKIDAVLQWNFQKTKLAQVDLTATILIPTKAATSPLKIVNPDLAA
ncbi:hypothetical protein EGT74_24540 [Chitinophaga lutea]|uniref:Uncharacterized protein n=1 Tax=Chitinophaga lutea TaxID=2488634 RepID=A0A3N4PBS5_9BACT|nr:hypothetical protein [Chitinophaga lutea]RPE05555.1 hypothetical protein EGT74_24540 [Chitinophaga lutea]